MESASSFWEQVLTVWRQGVYGVDLGQLLIALGVFLVFLFARRLFARFVIGFAERIAARTKSDLDDRLLAAVEAPLRFVFVVVGIYVAARSAPLAVGVDEFVARLVRSLIAFTIFWALYRCVDPLSVLINRLMGAVGGAVLRDSLRGFFSKVLKFALVCLGVAAVLQEWGFNVAAVLGGLGLMGMAVAFGAQNLIANLFAGLTIFLDNMFERGDWIRSGEVEGTVEEIGFRTTKIRRFDKAQVTVPNSAIAGNAVINFSRMTNRRIYWMIGVEYRTSQAQIAAIIGAIKDYVLESPEFETDPARATTLIHLDSFNASSIDIMLYCFTKTTQWAEWMAAKERLAYRIKEIVEGNGASFAFPSTSIYLETLPFGTPETLPEALKPASAQPA